MLRVSVWHRHVYRCFAAIYVSACVQMHTQAGVQCTSSCTDLSIQSLHLRRKELLLWCMITGHWPHEPEPFQPRRPKVKERDVLQRHTVLRAEYQDLFLYCIACRLRHQTICSNLVNPHSAEILKCTLEMKIALQKQAQDSAWLGRPAHRH